MLTEAIEVLSVANVRTGADLKLQTNLASAKRAIKRRSIVDIMITGRNERDRKTIVDH